MKMVGGNSTNDSISFISTKHKVILHENGTCNYNAMIPPEGDAEKQYRDKKEKEKKTIRERSKEVSEKNVFKKLFYYIRRKLLILSERMKSRTEEYFIVKHKFTCIYGILFLWEIVLMCLVRIFESENIMIGNMLFCSVFLLAGLFYIAKSVYYFSKNEKLKKNHSAEHMVYNCYLKGEDILYDNIVKQSRYSNRCGSCKAANYVFLEIINLLLSIFFRVWIPHSFIIFVIINLNIAIPGNFIARLFQIGLTKKPDKENIALAQKAFLILKNTEIISDGGVLINPVVFGLIIKATLENIKRDEKA